MVHNDSMRSSILNKWRQSPLNMETFNKNKIFKVFQNPTRQEIMKLWIMVQRYVKDIIFVLTSNILLNKTRKSSVRAKD